MVFAFAAIVFCVVITRDGELVVPQGKGIITLDVSEFDAFPLPDYAAKHVTDGYKCCFVAVEPGIKVLYLKSGPAFLYFCYTVIRLLDFFTGKWSNNCRPIDFG